ncbi:hypothetical protein EWM64_g8825 [Hericium alpestre]|uniref:Peptidase M14 domain-containing protein n=1 Tax=Hericium alpestre TaxID=135208 RepID=A0A4Y9ZNT2_9AGAM|nr:hypothetical protein EWM64_g8825 [Hericium alpestre]
MSSNPKNDVNNALGTSFDSWDLTSLENTTYHSTYHPLNDIYSFIHDLAATYPDLVSVVSLGHSGEGREMYALEISAGPSWNKGSHEQKWRVPEGNDVEEPLGFVITGAQHAREWVATATALYIAHALVVNKTEEYSLGHLLDRYVSDAAVLVTPTFYIVPVPNPDGYVHTWEHDRFWYATSFGL